MITENNYTIETILINIRDWKKKDKIILVESILKFGEIDLKKINPKKIK